MKLKDCKDWKALHFSDRTIMKSDIKFMGIELYRELVDVEVEPIEGRKGHYRVKQ